MSRDGSFVPPIGTYNLNYASGQQGVVSLAPICARSILFAIEMRNSMLLLTTDISEGGLTCILVYA